MVGMEYPDIIGPVPNICFADKLHSCIKLDTSSTMLVAGSPMEMYSQNEIKIGTSNDYPEERTPITKVSSDQLEIFDSGKTKIGVKSVTNEFIGIEFNLVNPTLINFTRQPYYNGQPIGMDQSVIDEINMRLHILELNVNMLLGA